MSRALPLRNTFGAQVTPSRGRDRNRDRRDDLPRARSLSLCFRRRFRASSQFPFGERLLCSQLDGKRPEAVTY